MKTDSGQAVGGMLAMTGKEFACKIGDTRDQIVADNPTLTEDEINEVFRITREHKEDDRNDDRNIVY